MEKKFWNELSDYEIKKIIRDKHSFRYINDHYKQPTWCAHANPLLPSFMGCEKLMNGRKTISRKSCANCPHFAKESEKKLMST